ncbi:uncharacterized protein LOC129312771 isoform X2 [Prosopis cineraria]|uniref:uncharacterized protein LOC129312771 isoform X2 n=1 Tax=Prosopis cineraria TaxID=364024 RepID=UPI00240FF000|nr:uncharacterized protein LOC129312771 isoform X2 [Prosopis cineraria]
MWDYYPDWPGIKESGIYMIREHCNMEDIRFTIPLNLDSLNIDQEFMEDFAKNLETEYNLSTSSFRDWVECMQEESIPEWFHKRTKGQSVSFWFRNNFPTLCGGVLLNLDCDLSDEFLVFIGGELRRHYHILKIGNTAFYGMNKFSFYNAHGREQAIQEGEWNYVNIYVADAKESGIYVTEQQYNKEDIRFTDPYVDAMAGNQECMERLAEHLETVFNLSKRSSRDWVECMREESIPEWFHKRTKGPSISFWFRNNFPTLCGGALLNPDYNLQHQLTVFINKEKFWNGYGSFLRVGSLLKVGNTAVYGLKLASFDEIKMGRAFREGEWNYVQINLVEAKQSGICVTELQYNKEDIRFTDPYMDAMVDNQEEGRNQYGASLEENRTMLNKKRPLIEDDNFASSSTHFRGTKRRGSSSTNQEKNNANLIEINTSNATETIGIREQEHSVGSKKDLFGNTLQLQKIKYESKMQIIDIQSPSRSNEEFLHARMPEENEKDKGIKCQMNPMQRLSLLTYADNFNSMTLLIDPVVLGKDDMTILVEQEDLERLLMRKRVTIQMMHVFLMYLHRHYTLLDKSKRFGFICPLHIQDTGNEEQTKLEYLQIRLSKGNQECYLAPYVHSDHWQLIILCPKLNTIVFLCSTHNEPRKEIKETMNTAMMTYQTMKEKKKSYPVKEPKWIVPKSRKQPMLSAECGYYIMSHMVNIITLGATEFSVEMFDNTNPLSSDELKDVCTHWARGFLEVANL